MSGPRVVLTRKCSGGEEMRRFWGQKDHFEKWFNMVQCGSVGTAELQQVQRLKTVLRARRRIEIRPTMAS